MNGGYYLRRLRDVFYINAFPENNEVLYYGMEFSEFVKYVPNELNQILLLKPEYGFGEFSSNTYLDMVDNEGMDRLLKEDIYSFGDFCWVDYNETECVERLEPTETAELLYLAHMFKPVNSPFFDKLQNRYAYLAHDDGWFCRLYCSQYSDIKEIISNKIIGMVSTSKRRKIYPISEDIKTKLLDLAENGLLIDFSSIIKESNYIKINIYCIGEFSDMDRMYNNLQHNIYNAKYSASLVHKNKEWKLNYIKEK